MAQFMRFVAAASLLVAGTAQAANKSLLKDLVPVYGCEVQVTHAERPDKQDVGCYRVSNLYLSREYEMSEQIAQFCYGNGKTDARQEQTDKLEQAQRYARRSAQASKCDFVGLQ